MSTTPKSTIHSFTERREFPWVTGGTKITESVSSVDEALEQAGLANWNVRKAELTAGGVRVPKKWGVLRDSANGSPQVLGVVGDRYTIHQNEEAFAPIHDILDSSDLRFATAGYRGIGQQTFVCLELPEGISVNGDPMQPHLIAFNSHDGSLAMTFTVMVGRFACFNALKPTLKGGNKFSIRHTSSSHLRIAEVREALELTFDYVDEFTTEMNRWMDRRVTDGEFEKIVETMLPIREGLSQGRVERVLDSRNKVFNLWGDSQTNEFARGTKYAAYNALNEFSNWYIPVRGDADGSKRAFRTLDENSVVSKFDEKAQRLLASV